MWPGQSTGICQENEGSTGMINDTLTSLRAYWKMRTTNSFGAIQTDHKIEARRQNLVLVDKREKRCQIIDMAIPVD